MKLILDSKNIESFEMVSDISIVFRFLKLALVRFGTQLPSRSKQTTICKV